MASQPRKRNGKNKRKSKDRSKALSDMIMNDRRPRSRKPQVKKPLESFANPLPVRQPRENASSPPADVLHGQSEKIWIDGIQWKIDSDVRLQRKKIVQSSEALPNVFQDRPEKLCNDGGLKRKKVRKPFRFPPTPPQKCLPPPTKGILKDRSENTSNERVLRGKRAVKRSVAPRPIHESPSLTPKNVLKQPLENFRKIGAPRLEKPFKSSQFPLEQVHKSLLAIPKGYVFVPKGNVYVTRNCRAMTKAQSRILYVVQKLDRAIGLHVPMEIYEAVMTNEKATLKSRAAAVQRADEASQAKASDNLKCFYPNMPGTCTESIVAHAFQKGSGRVGRTTRIDDKAVAQLAVLAHIRHSHTAYEKLLGTKTRAVARQQIFEIARQLEKYWAGKTPNAPSVPTPCGGIPVTASSRK